jgi:hypothetical protein
MKRVWTTIAVVAISLAPLRADVTITQTISIEGPMAAAMGGQEPKILLRIKGNKSRTDADVMNTTIASITDLDTKQLIVLNGTDKTAQITALGAPPAKPETPGGKPIDMDVTFKATGNTRKLEAGSCDDHSFSLTMDMSQFGNQAPMPPETAEMLKGVRIVANGISCIAKEGKGVGEFAAFQKAAVSGGLMAAAMGVMPGGAGGGGMEKLMSAVASAPGMPYITEIAMTFEGTGPMVDMMKQMGPMKIIQKTTNVSTDPISDDLFKVPADYKITEKK